jgi:hypothetical protein
MLRYNIYYKNERINNYPISKEEVEKIQSQKFIGKVNENTKEVTRIPTNDINIVKCYLV